MVANRLTLKWKNKMAKVGINTFIHPTAVIGENVTIGDNCYIGPLCIIGFPAEWKGREQEGKGVMICDNVRITGLVTIDSGADHKTIIGNDCYLMKHSHIGHDAILMLGCTISCGAKIGGHSVIGRQTNIGLNAVIHQKVNIPEGCMIGASAFIGKKTELKPYRKYAGVPARDIGENIVK
jgi:UDP-N-acetylglucosamine acyltransferase